jgi:hypothetical protein
MQTGVEFGNALSQKRHRNPPINQLPGTNALLNFKFERPVYFELFPEQVPNAEWNQAKLKTQALS